MFWDNVAWAYDIFADGINRKANRALRAVVAESIRPGETVLECACGTGLLSGAITERCGSLVATDLSEKMLRRAERKCARYGNVRFERGYILRIAFPDESFDAVVSNYVYHNVMGADKQALLLETLRVLKKGGVFAINDNMKPRAYGDMEAFAQELRDMGYEDVRLIDTAQEAFGSRRRAAMMMLGSSGMLVGRK